MSTKPGDFIGPPCLYCVLSIIIIMVILFLRIMHYVFEACGNTGFSSPVFDLEAVHTKGPTSGKINHAVLLRETYQGSKFKGIRVAYIIVEI